MQSSLVTHELGHNLTLAHSSSRGFGAEPLGALGTVGVMSEYGDPFSTMGSWNLGFYPASQAANQLGWLSQGANYTTVESAGTYTIQNYEARPAGVKALKVRRGTGNNAWLWLESRQPVNAYSSSLYATAHFGALVHYDDSFTSSDSHLLDFNANTAGNFSDAPLQVGRTWSDPYSNLTLTVNSVSSTGMTVTVNYGAKTCVASEPTVTLSPTAASAEQGKSTQLAVTVRNNSTAECGNEVFALASAAAGSLATTLGTASMTVSPGQVAQTTLNVAVPAGFALGTYPVSVAASGATSKLTGTGASNVTVTEPVIIVCSTAPPTLSVSPTDLSLMPRRFRQLHGLREEQQFAGVQCGNVLARVGAARGMDGWCVGCVGDRRTRRDEPDERLLRRAVRHRTCDLSGQLQPARRQRHRAWNGLCIGPRGDDPHADPAATGRHMHPQRAIGRVVARTGVYRAGRCDAARGDRAQQQLRRLRRRDDAPRVQRAEGLVGRVWR